MGSVDDCQFVARKVVPDRMRKGYVVVCNGCYIDTAMLTIVFAASLARNSSMSALLLTNTLIDSIAFDDVR